jgi:sigma-B regulation protein RsbU (phosphoserine phosphatase)
MTPAATKVQAAPNGVKPASWSSVPLKRGPRRPLGRLLLLALLFAGALAYHLRVTMYREQHWFGIDSPIRPFFVDQPGVAGSGEHNSMSFVVGNAFRAGLREGDALLAVNGRAATGTAVFGEELRKSRPGDLMTVSVLHHEIGQPPIQKTVSFSLQRVPEWNWQTSLPNTLLLVVLPFGCMLLGFWVASVRPRDPLAWLVLALMLSFTCFGDPNVECWPPYARDLGIVFRTASAAAFPIWLLLFGLYFPEPLPAGRDRARWIWLKWVMIVPLILLAVIGVVAAVGELENFAAVGFLERLPHAFRIAGVNLVYIVFAMPIYLIGRKYASALSADAKRRLRLLIAGSLVTLVPWWLMRAFAVIKDVNPELYLPFWLWFGIDILLFFFPIVLAYVIVVQRAMDVRFVVRQGLQYALARNGVRVIQIAVALAAFFAAAALMANSSSNRIVKLAVVLLGVALVPMAQRSADRLRHWVDRRFFREAYNAEKVLNDLSDQVRSMVEPQSLLETVVTRIADTLHVSRIAALLDRGNPYRPVYAVGFDGLPDIQISPSSAAVQTLQRGKEPLRISLDDENSWAPREAGAEKERAELARLHAELLLPLAGRDKLLGFISLGPKKSEEPFTGSDLRLLKSVANQTGLALENAQLLAAITEEVAHRERLNREVEIAREVQERLFPQELPAIAGLDYFGACRPALGVGGDYYDFLALPQGRLGIAIGDVSGKGIGAALIMASLEASLRAEAARGPEDLAALVGNVNRLVYQASTSNRYATFFYAQYDPLERKLVYVNAGHNPPILFRKCSGGCEILRLATGGTVVGLLEGFPYQQETLPLQPGDLLVAFTDGISEAMNPLDEEWGEERMIETIQSCSGQPADQLVSSVITAADAFASGAQQYDDMTLVVLRVQDEP